MNSTLSSGNNNSMHKNKNRFTNNRNHHRYNGNDSSNDQRFRHSAKQSLEKYLGLAREATVTGDKISAEYYLQYADHFHRVYHGLNNFEEDGEKKTHPPRYSGGQRSHHRPSFNRDRDHNRAVSSEESSSEVTNNLPKGEEALQVSSPAEENRTLPVVSEEHKTEHKRMAPPPLRRRRSAKPKKDSTEVNSAEESSISHKE
jgi:hypothetical protein